VRRAAPRGLPDRPTAGAVAFLGLLVLWLFRGALFGGGVFYRRDIHLVWHPQIETFVRDVVAGAWPLWNPSLGFGRPLLADPSAQVLYPLTWLNLLMRPWTYYTVFATVHALGATLGLFALARRIGVSTWGSAVAAGLWLLAGPYLSSIDLWHHYAGISWMPWVVLAADRAMGARSLRTAMAWGAVQGLQALAGSADACALTLVLSLAVGLSRHFRWRESSRSIGRLVATAGAAGATTIGLTAGLWWPALEQVRSAARADLPSAVRTYWSLHPLVLMDLLLPGLWSSLPLRESLRAELFESREPFIASLYLGAAALALVLAGLGASAHPLRRTLVVVGATSLVLALGSHTPVYGAVAWLFPPLRILRYPVKMTLLVSCVWALLAGMGLDAWRETTLSPRAWRLRVCAPLAAMVIATSALASTLWFWPAPWAARLLELPLGVSPAPFLASTTSRLLVVAGLTLAAAVLAWRRGGSAAPWLAGVAGLLALVDLAAYHRNPSPLAPRSLYTSRPEVLQLLGNEDPRVYVYDYSVQGKALQYLRPDRAQPPLARQPEGWTLDAAGALAWQMYLAPETAGRWGLRGSYEIDYRGLYPSRLEFLTLLLRRVEGTSLHLRLLRMGGVTHVVAMHSEGLEELKPQGEVAGLFAKPIRVFGVLGALPRAYAVGAARVEDGLESLGRALTAPDFDPSQEVVLSGGLPKPAPRHFVGAARIVGSSPDHVRIEATLSDDGYVVLLDGYDPGWRAEVDGQPARVYRANAAFRAVAVGAGTHVITEAYRPESVRWGLVVSVITVFLLLAAAARPLVEARTGSEVAP
jgi:Bacterial membrane protein YfhO